jgi:hypothetical protein
MLVAQTGEHGLTSDQPDRTENFLNERAVTCAATLDHFASLPFGDV